MAKFEVVEEDPQDCTEEIFECESHTDAAARWSEGWSGYIADDQNGATVISVKNVESLEVKFFSVKTELIVKVEGVELEVSDE